MIRPAKFGDVPRIVEMLVELQPRTVYAGRATVAVDYARKFVGSMIQRNGHTNEGGCLVNVVEGADRAVQAFMACALQRVYLIGDQFIATDIWLHGTDEAPKTAALRLIRAYRDWGWGNPRVIEVGLGWSDAIPSSKRIVPIIERMGFVPSGGSHVLRKPVEQRLAA